MPSLMELVERVNKNEPIEPDQLAVYLESSNNAEKFLANHAAALLDLRRAQQHMLHSLEAIDFGDQKVLNQFVSVTSFLGSTEARIMPMVRFGAGAVARREYAMGLEAISSGVLCDLNHSGGFISDRENALFVAAQYEKSAAAIPWKNTHISEHADQRKRIAIVVSSIEDGEASARMIAGLARHLDGGRFKLFVYSTECGVRREKQFFPAATFQLPSIRRGTSTLETLGQRKIDTWLNPLDGDLTAGAQLLATRIAADEIDVVLFDTTPADPIAGVLANWAVAPSKINIVRRSPMYVAGITQVLYMDQSRCDADQDFWQQRNVPARFVAEGWDMEDLSSPGPQRSAFGIPDNAIVLATSGNELEHTLSDDFVETMVNILRANPAVIYLLIGEGELSRQKRRFESAGVSKRVGYAGKRKDMPAFLRIADIYVSEFAGTSAIGVLQAMSVAKPIVAASGCDTITHAAGEEAIVHGGTNAYIERVAALIRESEYRTSLADSLGQRLQENFGFDRTARAIEQIVDELSPRITQFDSHAQAA